MTIALLSALCVVVQAPLSPEVERILEQHEQGLSRIHSLRAVLEGRISEDGGKTWRPMYEIEIKRSGRKQRVKHRTYIMRDASTLKMVNAYGDSLDTPEGRRSISITDAKSRDMSGRIMPPQPFGPHGYNDQAAAILMLLPGPNATLRDLCKETPGVQAVESTSRDGSKVWTLEVAASGGSPSFRVSVSPNHGYLLNERTVVDPAGDVTMYVAEFAEPRKGVYIPRLVRSDPLPSHPGRLTLIEVKDIEVNEWIADHEFDLRFPIGLHVAEERVGHGEIYHVWGTDGPAETFESSGEYVDWRDRPLLLGLGWPPRRIPVVPSVAVLLGCSILITMLIVRRLLRATSN